jgi:glucose uptake protein GlcU
MRALIFGILSVVFLIIGIILSIMAPKYNPPEKEEDNGKYGKYIAGAVSCYIVFVIFAVLTYYYYKNNSNTSTD